MLVSLIVVTLCKCFFIGRFVIFSVHYVFFSAMADTGDYLIREATQRDKQSVLALRKDVYGGRDYLPEYYDDFVCWPNVTPFVLLHKDEIVSFFYN